MIRLIIVLIFVVLFLIISLPIQGVEWLIRKRHKRAADLSSLRIVQWAFRVIIFLSGTKTTIIGEENVPKGTAVLYVGNHQGFYDTILTYARCPDLTGYVAKDSMLKIPVMSIWMKRLYCLFLNRDNLKEGFKTILKGIEQVKEGISMFIFPEGGRNKNPGKVMEFKGGSLKIAEKSGCPIVPVAITGTADIFENHLPWIKKCHVIIQYGEPIYIDKLEKEQKKFLSAYTQEKIQNMLDSHKNLMHR